MRFIAALIDTLRARYHVDAARVYVNGMSNGGGTAFTLSCVLADRIAAVGLVASAPALSWNQCRDARRMRMIAFHGTAGECGAAVEVRVAEALRYWPR